MFNYSKTNRIVGLLVGAFACIIYLMTAEASGSFWDCGEYIAAATKVQNPHPPGNPFFVLIGRIFVILFGDNPKTAAFAVNSLSAIASGVTIMFLFWITTYFAKKLMIKQNELKSENDFSKSQGYLVVFSGLIASLTFTFTDSFWFNAVEGEVYALSHFLLVLIFYLMIVWEGKADNKGADKYLIVIFLVIGLAVCIHLLDLLVIPALAMIFYYKKFKPTTKGAMYAFLIGCVIVGFVMVGLLQYTLVFAANLDMLFVNSFELPIFSGFVTFFVLLVVLCIYLLNYALKKGKYYLHLGIWCSMMVMLGYSTYNVVLIRSQADVSIDMNSPEDPLSFLNYILRLQYGDKPLLYGPVFTAGKEQGKTGPEYQPEYSEGKTIYAKKKEVVNIEGQSTPKQRWVYAESGKIPKITYNDEDKMLFPRLWQTSDDRGSRDFYANWLGIGKLKDKEGQEFYERAPTFFDNIKFFLGYQFGWMYLRYFMWNFVGRQNDIQGFNDPRDGNTISGITPIDNFITGADQNKLPDNLKKHASHNTLFAIPFILGLLGLFYQYKNDNKNFVINLSFFFFTGIAIILYLNDTGPQPRERDYSHTISFLAFASWIGLSIFPITNFLTSKLKNKNLAQKLAFVLLLGCPLLVASQEWDDHNRSNKTLVHDYAKTMLDGCPKNAVLFCYGDNDTYPLWYLQEVEGYRKDVRIINTSLLGIDWYINQLRYKVNESDPIDLIFTSDQIFGNKNDYVLIHENPSLDQTRYYDAYNDVFKGFVAVDDDKFKLPLQNGDKVNYVPTKKLFLKSANTQLYYQNNILDTFQKPDAEIRIELTKNVLYKNDLIVLAILSSSFDKRPICFTSEYESRSMGIGMYLQKRGMIYQFVPFLTQNSNLNIPATFNVLSQSDFNKSGKEYIYFDETNRQQILQIRESFADLANALASENDTLKAKKILDKINVSFPNKYFPYAMPSRQNQHNRVSLSLMQTAYLAKHTGLANEIYTAVLKDLKQQDVFYKSVDEKYKGMVAYEEQMNSELLKQAESINNYFQSTNKIKQ